MRVRLSTNRPTFSTVVRQMSEKRAARLPAPPPASLRGLCHRCGDQIRPGPDLVSIAQIAGNAQRENVPPMNQENTA
ncbi:MAG: hypothetical protein JWM88_3131 [Verrucomicrobia bacterium]|nr:hypothetical protein [Verrucomicrobiota bacterium]